MKKILSVLLCLAMLLSVLPIGGVSAADQSVPEGYTAIRTVLDLYKVRYDLSGNYILMNDLDLSEATASGGDYDYYGNGWNPIGSDDIYSGNSTFTGTFDGNGYTIRGIRIQVTALPSGTGNLYIGLFGKNAGTIQNVNVEGAYTSTQSKTTYVGGIAAYNTGNIVGCSNNVVISKNAAGYGSNYAGGIAGYNTGNISRCANTGEISWIAVYTLYAGGICGYGYRKSLVENCYNAATVSAFISASSDYSAYAGGIQGYISGYNGYKESEVAYIKKCYNVGTVSATQISYSIRLQQNAIAYLGNYTSVKNCYYLSGTGSNCTGATALSDALMQESSVLSGFDFDTVWTMGGDADYPYPELQCFALSGELGIDGQCSYLSTLQPDLSKVEKIDDTFAYEWLVDGETVSTETSFTIDKADYIGKTVQLKLTGTKALNKGTLYSEEAVISKAVQTQTVEPAERIFADDKQIQITTDFTQEYSLDNATWQTSGLFENLEPNKIYTVYARVAENDLYLPSESVAVLQVTTNRRPMTGSLILEGVAQFGEMLHADATGLLPDGVTYRLEWRRGDTAVGDGDVYALVQADIGQPITVYAIATDDYIGEIASQTVIPTKADALTLPAPAVINKTNRSVTLAGGFGSEYSMDKVHWQDSPVFEGLSVATTYTFYQRLKETDTAFAGACSTGTSAETLKNTVSAPSAPQIADVTGNTVTLVAVQGYQYSKDGVVWQDEPLFEGLRPFTEHTFYQRVAETDTDYASTASAATKVVTLKKHEYDNDCDAFCNICGDEREVGDHVYDHDCDTTCKECGAANGSIQHSYKKQVIKATLDADGEIYHQCEHCGYISSKTTVVSRPLDFSLSATSYTYNGAVKKPTVTVKDAAGNTISSSNYTVTYADGRKNAGTYTVTVKMKGNYSGTKTLTFEINPIDVSKCTFQLSTTAYTYNGTVRTPNVVVKNANGTTLTKNTHYTVTYASGRKNAGTYSVTVKMKGNYSGTKTLTFKIKPIDVSKCTFQLSTAAYTYNGAVKTPNVTVKNANGTTLTKNTHYTVTYADGRKNAGTYKVTVKMKGNYSGTKTLTFKIKPIDISKCTVKLSKTSYYYDGATKTPSVVVKNANGTTLTKNTHYTVTYASGRKNVGTHKVTVKMKGNYSGTKTLTFKVVKTPASKVTVSASKTAFAYNGKMQIPTLTLKNSSGKTMTRNTDYTLKLPSGRKNVGTYEIKITFKGNYTGTKTVKYTIAPTVKSEMNLLVGDASSIGAKSNTKITYSSSNKSVATVSSKGVVTAVRAGTATVTVKSGAITKKVTVKVTTPSINITGNASSVYRGNTLKLSAAVNPAGAKVTWSTSNSTVAKVSSAGVVTGLKQGTVTVTAKITSNGKVYQDTYTVKVNVETPKISVFVTQETKYQSSAVVIVTNSGSKPMKVLNRGSVSNSYNSKTVTRLFTSDEYYVDSATISANSRRSIALICGSDKIILNNRTTYIFYFEYDGELYSATAYSGVSGMNKCTGMTHYID